MIIADGEISEATKNIAKAIEDAGQAQAAAIENGILTLAESIKYLADAYTNGKKLEFQERNKPVEAVDKETFERFLESLGLPKTYADTTQTGEYDNYYHHEEDIPF